MHPKIISLGFSLPPYSYKQEEVFGVLKYPTHFYRLFAGSQIERRYFCMPLEDIKRLSFQSQQECYLALAPKLSLEAIKECLDTRPVGDIGLLSFATCTGFPPGPAIPHYLGQRLGLSANTFYTNIAAMGCESSFPGLRRAYDFVVATGKPALSVNCELTSLTFWPEPDGKPEPENGMEVLRANAIFADAATACLVGYDSDWHHPEIIDMETHTNFDYIDDLGYVWRNGRLRVRLSKRVPELAPLVVKPALDAVLKRQGLNVSAIAHWVIHAAGSTVLDNIRDAVGIPEIKMLLSRETLRQVGNTSSTSVAITGKRLMTEETIRPGDYVAVLGVGPGMSGSAVILRFSKE
jgi:predicted naringenin-chalcone synthase